MAKRFIIDNNWRYQKRGSHEFNDSIFLHFRTDFGSIIIHPSKQVDLGDERAALTAEKGP